MPGDSPEVQRLRAMMAKVVGRRSDVIVSNRESGPVLLCLAHNQTDCSPMLNGCSAIASAVREVDEEAQAEKVAQVEEVYKEEAYEPPHTDLLRDLTARPGETPTAFAIRCIKAEGWLEGHYAATTAPGASAVQCPYL